MLNMESLPNPLPHLDHLVFVVAGRDVVAEMGGSAHAMVISVYLAGFSELRHTIWYAPPSPGPRIPPLAVGPRHLLTN